MNRRWSGSVLPLVFLLCFLIAVGLGLYALHNLRIMLVRERGADLARTAARVAEMLDRILFERAMDIEVFAHDALLREGTPDEKRKKLGLYKNLYTYYSWIAVTDSNGRIVATTDPPTAPVEDAGRRPPGVDAGRQEWFQEVRRSGRLHLMEAQFSPESGGVMAVGFSAPMYGPQREFRGVVTSRVPLEQVRAVLEQEGELRYGEGKAHDWLLVDRRGVVISEAGQDPAMPNRRDVPKLDVPSVALAARADRNQAGFVEEMHLRRQVPVLTGYARTQGYAGFPGFDWTVLVRLDRDLAYAPINKLVWTVGGVGLLIVAPLTGFGIWASRKLVQESRALRQAQQELQQSLIELSRSNRDLQQFAYVASHDLQEPLRMVSSYMQLLARRYRGKLDQDADEFIGYAVDGAMRMQKLIQDLLAYSRIQTQGKALEPTDCRNAVNEALVNLRAAVEESRAVVTAGPLPTVMADERQLSQLFQNLIGNAIKFRGTQEPRVHISAERKGDEWLFSVSDNGIGIDPQYMDRIFVLFQRLHTQSEYPGTGIGLALCKKIVERHGGRIWVESTPGKGATFYFTLPDPAGQRSSLRSCMARNI